MRSAARPTSAGGGRGVGAGRRAARRRGSAGSWTRSCVHPANLGRSALEAVEDRGELQVALRDARAGGGDPAARAAAAVAAGGPEREPPDVVGVGPVDELGGVV